jgi:4-amino-4-deoxy-L-arabinose transferase-like glycosyltransferase
MKDDEKGESTAENAAEATTDSTKDAGADAGSNGSSKRASVADEASEADAKPKEKAAPSRKLPQIPAWAVAVGLPILFFFIVPPLSKSGIWDPYELNVADLARRVGLNLHGASDLRLEGADNSLPHLNDLGRPQLPFTAMAIGFQLFGLREWAGRLPLALFGLFGVIATYAWVSRMVDKRAGAFAAVALTTTPLYFVQARTMLGDIVTMSAMSMAFGGLLVVLFDRRPDDQGPMPLGRIGYLALAILGLVCGFYSRGAAVGLGIPLAAIGLSWAVLMASGQKHTDYVTDALGALSIAAAGYIFYKTVGVMAEEKVPDMSPWAGAMVHAPTKYPTFDYFVSHVGHAMVPWSAFVPFAMGRMFIAPKGKPGLEVERESVTRMALIVASGVALGVHGWLAARTDLMAFSAPAVLAAICGIALRDYERGAHPSIAVGVGTAVFLGLFHHDMHGLPEKAFQAFAVVSTTFPESFKAHALSLWTVVLVGFAGIAFLTWVDRDAFEGIIPAGSRGPVETGDQTRDGQPKTSDATKGQILDEAAAAALEDRPFNTKNYARLISSLLDAWDGMLALIYFAIVAGACLAGLAVWAGQRTGSKWLPTIGSQTRDIVINAWWISAFVPLAAVLGIFFWYDVWRWAFRTREEATFASAMRGFEPLEELAAELVGKGRNLTAPAWSVLLAGIAKKDDKKKDAKDEKDAKDVVAEDQISVPAEDDSKATDTGVAGEPTPFAVGLVTLVVMVPLMYLQVPLATYVGLTKAGVHTLPAVAIALPSGVGVFLLLGLVSQLVRGSRAAFMALSATVLSAVLCFSYYPALANQLSPKEVFESYRNVKKADEPLGLLGVGGRTAAYYAGGQPPIFKDAQAAFTWLSAAEPGQRRFLAASGGELSRLNALFRSQPKHGNVPVLDARSSQIMLVASSLLPNEKNENPLAKVILGETPKPQHKLDANMEDILLCLGYDLLDAETGRLVDSVTPRKKYKMKTYYQVLAPVTREWESFIHIDGYHRRHNGDHKLADGKYPFALWQVGDYIADDYEFSLEPNFGAGSYTIYFGLFQGETRLKVKSGPSDSENRINGGTLRVK